MLWRRFFQSEPDKILFLYGMISTELAGRENREARGEIEFAALLANIMDEIRRVVVSLKQYEERRGLRGLRGLSGPPLSGGGKRE